MVKLYLESSRAARSLAEGDVNPTIEFLEGEGEVGRELRDTIATMLRGNSVQGTRLEVREKPGGSRKDFTNFERDWEIYRAIEKLRDDTGLSIESACGDLAEARGDLGEDMLKIIHRKMSRAFDEYQNIQHEG